ncbi:transposase [Wolbachia endosymbiont of Litomosoides sigmodontis]
MDCASCNKSKNLKVKVHKNIEVIYLPSYLPKLNYIKGLCL